MSSRPVSSKVRSLATGKVTAIPRGAYKGGNGDGWTESPLQPSCYFTSTVMRIQGWMQH